MDTIQKTAGSFWASSTAHKAAAIGIMTGGLILMDSVLSGTGLMLAGVVLFLVVIRSDIPDKTIQVLAWARKELAV